jgi:hypothetical protein
MRKSLRRVVLPMVIAGTLIALTASTALATSPDDPSDKVINGCTDATMYPVYNAFTEGYTSGGTAYTPDPFGSTVGAWDPVNPVTGAIGDSITPVTGGDTFPRPSGAAECLAALSAAWGGPSSCWTSLETGDEICLTASETIRHEELTFAAVATLPSESLWTTNPSVGSSNDDLTFIPQAIDAVGVAEQVNGTANPVDNLNTAALTAIYTGGTYTQSTSKATVGDVQESGGYPYLVTGVNALTKAATLTQVVPVVPEVSSDTRSFFLGAIGASSFDTAIVANETGDAAQEESNVSDDLSTTNVDTALTDNSSSPYSVPANSIEIAPLSGASLIEQLHGLVTDTVPSSGVSFPTINSDTLYTGSGTSAAIGTLQTAQAPEVTYGDSVVGDFARYGWGVLPSSVVVTGDPTGEGALQTWLDQTLEDTASQTVWTNYGFDPIGTSISDDSANWITTEWTN